MTYDEESRLTHYDALPSVGGAGALAYTKIAKRRKRGGQSQTITKMEEMMDSIKRSTALQLIEIMHIHTTYELSL